MQMKANTDNKNIQKKNLVVQLKEKNTSHERKEKRESYIWTRRQSKQIKEREKKQRERGAKLSRFYIY